MPAPPLSTDSQFIMCQLQILKMRLRMLFSLVVNLRTWHARQGNLEMLFDTRCP